MPRSQMLEDGREVIISAPSWNPVLDVLAELREMIGGIRDGQDRQRAERNRLNQLIYPIAAIPIGSISAATGQGSVLDMGDLAGPKTGQTWFVTRLTATTFSAGSVNVYYDNANGTPIANIASAGTTWLSATQLPVTRGHRLVFAAGSSFDGPAYVEIGVINVADELVGAYLL